MTEVLLQIVSIIFSLTGQAEPWACFDEVDEWSCTTVSQAQDVETRTLAYVGDDEGIQSALDAAKPVGSLYAEAAPREEAKPAAVSVESAPVAAAEPVAVAPVEPVAPVIEEDEENWNCFTMGNGDCGDLPFYPVAQDGTLGPCVYTSDYYVMCPGGETYWGMAQEDIVWAD